MHTWTLQRRYRIYKMYSGPCDPSDGAIFHRARLCWWGGWLPFHGKYFAWNFWGLEQGTRFHQGNYQSQCWRRPWQHWWNFVGYENHQAEQVSASTGHAILQNLSKTWHQATHKCQAHEASELRASWNGSSSEIGSRFRNCMAYIPVWYAILTKSGRHYSNMRLSLFTRTIACRRSVAVRSLWKASARKSSMRSMINIKD